MTEDQDYVYKAEHYPGPPVLIPNTIDGCLKMIEEKKGQWCTNTWEEYLRDRMEILRLRRENELLKDRIEFLESFRNGVMKGADELRKENILLKEKLDGLKSLLNGVMTESDTLKKRVKEIERYQACWEDLKKTGRPGTHTWDDLKAQMKEIEEEQGMV